MWNVKTEVILLRIGATGSTWKSFRKYLNSVPEKHEIRELQKTAILDTARAHSHTHTHTHIGKY
jgi:hypothetical protein